jgi:hypothetical protein
MQTGGLNRSSICRGESAWILRPELLRREKLLFFRHQDAGLFAGLLHSKYN